METQDTLLFKDGTKIDNDKVLKKQDSVTYTVYQQTYQNYFRAFKREKSSLEKIQEQLNKIQDKNMKVLYKLGEGGQAQVVQVIDRTTRMKYALKQYHDERYFQQELSNMQLLDKIFSDSLKDYLAELTDIDQKTFKLYYESGECSLSEFNQKMKEQNIFWFNNQKQLKRVAFIISQIIYKFSEHNFFHGDIKPDNIILYNTGDFQNLSIKLIDIGISTFDYKSVLGMSPLYSNGKTTFRSKNERLQSELYQLGRTLQFLMQSSVENYENNQLNVINFDKKDAIQQVFFYEKEKKKLKQSIEKLSQYYDSDIIEILQDFLLNSGSSQQISDVKEKILKLQTEMIQDSQNFALTLLKEKIKKRFDEEEKNYKKNQQTDEFIKLVKQEIEDCMKLGELEMGINILSKYKEQLEFKKNPKFALLYLKFLKFGGRDQEFLKLSEEIKPYMPTYQKQFPTIYHSILVQLMNLEKDKDKKLETILQVIAFYKDQDQFIQCNIFIEISQVCIEYDMTKECLEYIDEALYIFTQDKNKFIIQDDPKLQLYMAQSYTIKGEALRIIDNYKESMECLNKSFEIFDKLKYAKSVRFGHLLFCMGFTNEKLENINDAIYYYQQSLKILKDSIGQQHLYYTWSLNRLSHVYKITGNIKECIKSQELAVQIIYQMGYQGSLKQIFIDNLKESYQTYQWVEKSQQMIESQDQEQEILSLQEIQTENESEKKELLIANIQYRWIQKSKEFEKNEIFSQAQEYLNIAKLFLPDIPVSQSNAHTLVNISAGNLEEEIKKEKVNNEENQINDQEQIQKNIDQQNQQQQNYTDLHKQRIYIDKKLKIIHIKKKIHHTETEDKIKKFQDYYDELMEKVEDQEQFKDDEIYGKQKLCKIYIQNKINLREIIVLIDEFVQKLSQKECPTEYSQFIYTLAILNEKIGFYERAFELFNIAQKFINKYQIKDIQIMLDKNFQKFKESAEEAKAVRILMEKKKQYEYLKYHKTHNRTCDVIRLGLNIANIYQKDKLWEESQQYINEVMEFVEKTKPKDFPTEEYIAKQLYQSRNLQSPRSRSLSPTSISSIQGLSIQQKNNFSNAMKQYAKQQEIIQQKNKSEYEWDDNTFPITKQAQQQFETKQSQKRQAELMLNRVKEQRVIEQIQKRKKPPYKFIENKKPEKIKNTDSSMQMSSSYGKQIFESPTKLKKDKLI